MEKLALALDVIQIVFCGAVIAYLVKRWRA